MSLRPEEIYLYARQAGFSPDQAVTMTAIALAESGGNPRAHNPVGEDSIGLWQVNREAHPRFHGADGTDPLINAQMAYEVSGGGADIGRWTVTHADKGAPYLQYRDQAEQAAVAAGEPGATGQWNPPANYHSPKVAAGSAGPADGSPPPPIADGEGPGQIAAPMVAAPMADGQGPTVADSAGDGLLDDYKRAIGLDPTVADTDRDGFSDSVELLHGADPLDFTDNPLVGPASEGSGSGPAVPLTTAVPPAGAVTGAGPGAVMTAQSGAVPATVPPGAVAPETVPPAAGPGAAAMTQTPLDTFVDAALSQDGADYVFGSEVDLDDPDPLASGETFDCSELIQWAAAQAGVEMPDGSWIQYLHLRDQDAELTVEEALRTPGALIFNFSSEPVAGGGRPEEAHVGISLGDGRLMEARSSRYGVSVFDAEGREFSHAAYIPELGTELTEELVGLDGAVLAEPLSPSPFQDSDGDGLLDAYELWIGTDPFAADTDRDGFSDSVELLQGFDPVNASGNPLVGSLEGSVELGIPLTTDVPLTGTGFGDGELVVRSPGDDVLSSTGGWSGTGLVADDDFTPAFPPPDGVDSDDGSA